MKRPPSLFICLLILAIFLPAAGQKQSLSERVPISKSSALPSLLVAGTTIVDDVAFSGLDAEVDADDERVEPPIYERNVRELLRSDKCDIQTGDKLDLAKTEQIIKTLHHFLANLGYFSAHVTVFGEPESNDRIRLIVSVEKGPRFRVWDIEFRGNRNFGEDELEATMRECLGDSWGTYDMRHIDYCAQKNVRELMYSRGYFKAKVLEVSRRFSTSGLWITVGVFEGVRYRLGDIRIKGERAFSEAKILKMLGQKSGAIADGRALQELVYEKLEQAYKEKGYLNFNAEFDTKFREPTEGTSDGVINIDLTIDEGWQFTIAGIEFAGVSKETQRRLLQNLTVKPKDIYNQTIFEKDIEKLNQTNEFRLVDRDRNVELLTDENQPVVYITIRLKPRSEAGNNSL